MNPNHLRDTSRHRRDAERSARPTTASRGPRRPATVARSRETKSLGTLAALLLLAVLAFLAVTALPVPAESPAPPHLELLRAEPAADSTATEVPTEVRLYFSEAPVMSGTTVRLVDAAEELVPTGETVADEDDPRQIYIELAEEGLLPGDYTVHWRVIAQDGHAQRGVFGFRLQPE